ncbi:RAD52 motif-containing protein 1 [Acipenser oxyrinchus oxyrinchus]|uniref:RAD52 motif-containing protein 1 n=1 Tax=Acipenser oxyrinchus oxyrinchus TaxID=40147 RepID=A0AAD8CYE0_ACIOX|nr:RAD52 motif-containing protein 1 [Acipenser oxyrinchus oxyrinchus]
MDIEADLIEFKVPVENNKTLFVWNILPKFSEAEIYNSVEEVFSKYGALYSVRVCQNAAVAEPGYYAIVKFYSAAQASKAQVTTNGKGIFQESPLKVRLCTKQNTTFQQRFPYLKSAKCQELANYYLGFNGWSNRIVTLKDISQTGEQENKDPALGTQTHNLKYGCVIELIFPNYGVCCRGVGVAEELFENNTDPLARLMKRGQVQKLARERAMSDAFQKVLFVVLGNGKVAVECRFDPDQIVPDEELGSLIQVNDISWNQFEQEGEDDDILSELSFNVTHLQ